MKKRIALLLCLCMLSGTGFAELPDFAYNAAEFAVEAYHGMGGDVVIPRFINDGAVESIRGGVFAGNGRITALTLPNTLFDIGNENICDMAALEAVLLPDSLVAIDDHNFVRCTELDEVVVPPQVSYIGDGCFSECENLTGVYFTGEVPVFGADCFERAPEGLTVFVPHDRVEAYTDALPGHLNIQHGPDAAIVYDFGVSERFFEFGGGVVTGYVGFSSRVDMPRFIGKEEVTAIGANAFEGDRCIYYITLPEGVARIGEHAFSNCLHLCHVQLPDALESIGAEAFAGYSGSYIDLNENVKSIADRAFANAGLRSITLPGSLESLGSGVFADCTALEEVIVCCDPGLIAPDVFAGCTALGRIFAGSALTDEQMQQLSAQTGVQVQREGGVAQGPVITQQIGEVTVAAGQIAHISVIAEGEGLTYAWYYRNAGAADFALTTTFKGNTYAVEMNDVRAGREIYCVVTDQNGAFTISDTITLNMAG